MKKIIAIIVFIIFIGFLTTLPQEKPLDRGEKPLKVGVILSLTGPGAALGEDLLRAFELEYESLDRNFEYVLEDSQSKPANGVSIAQKLITIDNVDVLVVQQTGVVMPVIPLGEKYNIPIIGVTIAEKAFVDASEYTFKLYPHETDEAALLARFAEHQGYNRIGILTVNETYGQGFNKAFTENYTGDVILNSSFLVTENDHRLVLSQFVQEDVDAIYFIGYPPHHVNFLRQRTELGIDIPILSITHLRSEFVKERLDVPATNIFASTPTTFLNTPDTRDFRERFEKGYGFAPDWNAPAGYQTVHILEEIAQNPDQEPLETLTSLSIDVLGEPIDFNTQGETDIRLVVVNAETDEIIFE